MEIQSIVFTFGPGSTNVFALPFEPMSAEAIWFFVNGAAYVLDDAWSLTGPSEVTWLEPFVLENGYQVMVYAAVAT